MHAPTPFKKNALTLAIHACCYSMLSAVPVAQAGPVGGEIVGGSGSITQSGLTTTINQASQNLAANWQSFDVNSNERVQFIQPNSTSIALNRILSNNGSTIAGRIDANGKVILVNPNGIFFTPTASLNVGSIIASGLDITPNDFMNGNYIFNEIPNSNGAVINSGMINAALGGNVALLGKQVQNTGLISATLGSVTLAAGKQAVLTFDNGGLLGVRVSEAMLQQDLGVDPAVMNSGTIQAQGGRVLLTASVSQDVFSKAVNTTGVEPATSVVVSADGTFTLGSGADVVNSGSIDTSATGTNQNAGRIVLLGDNVTSSGSLKTDAASGNGGDIELHSTNMTLLTQNSVTSARSETNGQGGIVKVLGDKVGMFDYSTVDVSGANGGGQALIGGDAHGSNLYINNASRTYVSSGSMLYADALQTGNGGKIINWGNDYTWFYGHAFARGSNTSGDGGFVEISGKGLSFDGAVDTSALYGRLGTVLFDPTNITILDSTLAANSALPTDASTLSNPTTTGDFTINQTNLESLASNTNIDLEASNNITINTITDLNHALNLRLTTGSIKFVAGGAFSMDPGNFIWTRGGSVSITGASVLLGGIDTAGNTGLDGGAITVKASAGDLSTGYLVSDGGVASSSSNGRNAGVINVNASGKVSILGAITATGSDGSNSGSTPRTGGNAGAVSITAGSSINLNSNIAAVGGAGGNGGPQGNGANITFSGPVTLGGIAAINAAGTTSGNIIFNNTLDSLYTTPYDLALTGQDVTFNGAVGSSNRLGALSINAARAVNASTNTITANSLDVIQSNSFTSGAIDTSGVTTGGAVTINSGTIKVGTLNTSAATTGGAVTLAATDNTTNGTPSITLDGDVNTAATTQGAVQLSLNGTSTPTGTVAINYTGNFTSNVNITGSSGADALKVANRINSWILTGTNAGSLNTNVTFSAIENLVGGNAADTFTFNNGSSLSGTVDGGAGIDSVNLAAITTPVSVILGTTGYSNIEQFTGNNTDSTLRGDNIANAWAITGANSGTVNIGSANGVTFAGFNKLVGGSANDIFTLNAAGSISGSIAGGAGTGDTLIAQDLANAWTITGADMGTLVNSVGTTAFSQIENLKGGASTDTFNFNNASSISGTVDGGAGIDSVNLSAVTTPVSVTLGTTGYSNIEQFTGNNTDSTLRGDNIANAWAITGANSGTVNAGSPGTLSFASFNKLVGGSSTDDFIFGASGSLSGTVDGGAGIDSVNLAAITTPVSVILSTTGYSNIEQFTGNNTDSTLRGDNIANAWAITGANSGTVNAGAPGAISFAGFNKLVGGSSTDNFVFGGSGSLSGFIDGAVGTDSVNLSALPLVDVALGTGGTYRNIESFTGNNTASTLRGDNSVNTWTLTGQNDGTVNGTSFVNFNNLVGNSYNDTFNVVTGGQLTGLITGGSGANTLDMSTSTDPTTVRLLDAAPAAAVSNPTNILTVFQVGTLKGNTSANQTLAPDVSNPLTTTAAWNISAVNSGSVNFGPVALFSGFKNLSGTAVNDTFTLTNSTTPQLVTGLITGGGQSAGGQDQLILTGMTGTAANVTVQLGNTVTPGSLQVNGIENIQGSGSSTLIADNVTNDWTITAAAAGSLVQNVGVTNDLVNFSNFGVIKGGSGDDNFKITFNGPLGMGIFGGAQVTQDTIDYSAQSAPVVNFGAGAFNGIQEIEAVRGNGTNSTLNGPTTGTASWALTGVNTGAVTNNSGFTLGFEGFNYLVGGSGNNTFNINGGSLRNLASSVPGLIRGGSGSNTVNVNLDGTGTSPGQVDYLGNASNSDTININNTSPTAYAAAYTPAVVITDANNSANSGTYQQLSYSYANPSSGVNSGLTLNYQNAGTVSSQLSVNTFTVNGSNSAETTQLGNGNFSVGGRTSVGYSNVANLTATGLGPIAVNNTNIGGVLTLAGAGLVTINGLTAGTLALNNIGQAGSSTTRLDTNIGNLSITNSGPVYLTEQNNLALGAFTTSGLVDILANGSITSSAPLVSTGALTVATVGAANNISLTGQNALSGAISLTGNDINLNNGTTTNFASVNAASFTATSSGDVSQTGAIIVPGLTTLTTTASGSTISLTHADNDFNILNINAPSAVMLNDKNRIDSGSITASNITLTTANGIGNTDAASLGNHFVTNTAKLKVNNSVDGGVFITNNGAATVSITNFGNIEFTNKGSLVIDRLYTNGEHVDPTPATPYNTVTLRVEGGGIQAYQKAPPYPDLTAHSAFAAPDITAYKLDAQVLNGGVGNSLRRLSVKIVDTFNYLGGAGYIYYYGGEPPNIHGAQDLISFSAADALPNQQLIEIDSLGDFDPAIFTAVRNYYYEDVAIMMPADQRIDGPDEDEDENDKDKKKEEKKL